MTDMNPRASIEEKMDLIMSKVRALDYIDRVSKHDLTTIIMREWGASIGTIKMALGALERFDRIKAINPHVYMIIGSWREETDETADPEDTEDDTAAEELFTAKTVEEDFRGMLRRYKDRHPKGMKGGPSAAQDLNWIKSTKGRYGLQGVDDSDLYKKLQEGLQ